MFDALITKLQRYPPGTNTLSQILAYVHQNSYKTSIMSFYVLKWIPYYIDNYDIAISMA